MYSLGQHDRFCPNRGSRENNEINRELIVNLERIAGFVRQHDEEHDHRYDQTNDHKRQHPFEPEFGTGNPSLVGKIKSVERRFDVFRVDPDRALPLRLKLDCIAGARWSAQPVPIGEFPLGNNRSYRMLVNVLSDGQQWSGGREPALHGKTLLSMACADFDGVPYLFAIGTDQRTYFNFRANA